MTRILLGLCLVVLTVYGNDSLRVGIYQDIVNSGISKKDYIMGTSVLLKAFTEDGGVHTDIIYYDDPKTLGEDFKAGKIDLIAADALSIVKYIPLSHLENGVMSFKNSKADAQTLLIVGLRDDKRSFEKKLKGGVASDADACSEFYFKTLMLDNSITSNADFILTKNPQQSLLKLFFEKADLALVDRAAYNTAIELNPQLKSKLIVLKSVPLTIGPVSYMRKGISPELRKTVISLGKQLNTTPRGKQLLQLFRASYIDDSYTKDLESVYLLYNKHEALINRQSKKGF